MHLRAERRQRNKRRIDAEGASKKCRTPNRRQNHKQPEPGTAIKTSDNLYFLISALALTKGIFMTRKLRSITHSLGSTRRDVLVFSAAATCLGTSSAFARSYPSRPVSMVVAYSAGGQADAIARAVAPSLQSALGQTVVIENLPGVGGSMGAQKVLAAPPDGYTVLFGTPIELVQTPMAVASVKYKPESFRMVGPVASTYLIMIVRADLPVASVVDFVALAKRSRTKELSYGSVGRGTAYHLVAERFAQETGVKMLHIPYKAAQQLITDLAGGQIDMAFLAMGGPVPGLLQTGKFKGLGFTGPTRHLAFPTIPTMNETQVVKDFVFDLWGSIMVPMGLPEPVVARLSNALSQVLVEPKVRSSLEAMGVQPADPMDQVQAARFYGSEIARYRNIGQSINLKPE